MVKYRCKSEDGKEVIRQAAFRERWWLKIPQQAADECSPGASALNAVGVDGGLPLQRQRIKVLAECARVRANSGGTAHMRPDTVRTLFYFSQGGKHEKRATKNLQSCGF